ncbi:MAG: MFS transporter [Acidimicrobiales bacterium]
MSGATRGTGGAGPTPAELISRPLPSSVTAATWALFVGLTAVFVSAGLFASIVAVRATHLDFGSTTIALMLAVYYVGFLGGSMLTVELLGRVGHVRVYAALAALQAATMLLVGVWQQPVVWIVLRAAAGLSLAGIYVTADSWLNQLASTGDRGRLLAVYSIIGFGAFGFGQALVGPVGTDDLTGFAVVAMLMALAVIPVALSEAATAPPVARGMTVSLAGLSRQAPTGVGLALLAGTANSVILALTAIWAARGGLGTAEVGILVAAPSVGVLVLQWPIGFFSDRVDRRIVGAVVSAGALLAGLGLLATGPDPWPAAGVLVVVGGCSFPLYSIALAATNDWIDRRQVAGAGSKIVMLYGIGAVAGPLFGSAMMAAFGQPGFVWAVVVLHAAVLVFLVHRLVTWRNTDRYLHPEGRDSAVPPAPYRVFVARTTVAVRRRPRVFRRHPAVTTRDPETGARVGAGAEATVNRRRDRRRQPLG